VAHSPTVVWLPDFGAVTE
jgi:hypothetical protein